MINLKIFIPLLFSVMIFANENNSIDFSFTADTMDKMACEDSMRFFRNNYQSLAQRSLNVSSDSKKTVKKFCKDLSPLLPKIDMLTSKCDMLESKYPGFKKQTIPFLRQAKDVFRHTYNRECKVYEEELENERLMKLIGR